MAAPTTLNLFMGHTQVVFRDHNDALYPHSPLPGLENIPDEKVKSILDWVKTAGNPDKFLNYLSSQSGFSDNSEEMEWESGPASPLLSPSDVDDVDMEQYFTPSAQKNLAPLQVNTEDASGKVTLNGIDFDIQDAFYIKALLSEIEKSDEPEMVSLREYINSAEWDSAPCDSSALPNRLSSWATSKANTGDYELRNMFTALAQFLAAKPTGESMMNLLIDVSTPPSEPSTPAAVGPVFSGLSTQRRYIFADGATHPPSHFRRMVGTSTLVNSMGVIADDKTAIVTSLFMLYFGIMGEEFYLDLSGTTVENEKNKEIKQQLLSNISRIASDMIDGEMWVGNLFNLTYIWADWFDGKGVPSWNDHGSMQGLSPA